jgi:catechol 2,3-dioxygenase-like lactoylglutathione lyase family enzyme
MPRALSIHHVAIKVSDLGQAESFWSGVLGLEVLRRQSDVLGERSLWFGLGHDVFLAVERADMATPKRMDEAPGWHCIALSIEKNDRETWRTRLHSAGFPVVRETDYTLYVREPDGALVALSHYPEHAVLVHIENESR